MTSIAPSRHLQHSDAHLQRSRSIVYPPQKLILVGRWFQRVRTPRRNDLIAMYMATLVECPASPGAFGSFRDITPSALSRIDPGMLSGIDPPARLDRG